MKDITKIYDACSMAIRIAFFGFILTALGFLIENESVNLFYTFKSTLVLYLAEGSLKLGIAIVNNLPLIFMLNIVCKRANSAFPVVLALVGYLAFLISTMLFAPSTLASTAYSTSLGINSLFNISTGTRLPLETGLIGSFIVGYITRFSFIRSRHRTTYSILGFLNKDSAGIIYNIVFCCAAGIVVSYAWPIAFNYLQTLITFIGKNYADPVRMMIYGIADRVLSMLSLSSIIRQPFWYTALGGSYQAVTGQTILGDVSIWEYVKTATSTYIGAGRFITPYYVINMFMVPGILYGLMSSVTDKQERGKIAIPFLAGSIMSIICGNPMPIELVMLFTSPLLLVFYLLVVGAVFYIFTYTGIYLGSSAIAGSIAASLPGNFPDFIINIRNLTYFDTLLKIVVVGLAAGVIMYFSSRIYYHHLAFDFTNSGKIKEFSNSIVEACGGKENIVHCGSGLFICCVHLANLEKADIEMLKNLKTRRVTETKDGFDIECGSSAYIISKSIRNSLKVSD